MTQDERYARLEDRVRRLEEQFDNSRTVKAPPKRAPRKKFDETEKD